MTARPAAPASEVVPAHAPASMVLTLTDPELEPDDDDCEDMDYDHLPQGFSTHAEMWKWLSSALVH